MRNLTKVAIVSVVVAVACGVFHPVRGDHSAFADRPNDKIARQLIWQGADQNDQNLKLLLAAKIYEGGASVPDNKVHADPADRASDSDRKPSS